MSLIIPHRLLINSSLSFRATELTDVKLLFQEAGRKKKRFIVNILIKI